MFNFAVLAHNVRTYRKLKGLTQTDVAKKLHVCVQAVSKWERSAALPDLEKLCGLATLFEVSLDELLGNTYEETTWMIAVDGGGSKSEFLLFNSNGEIAKRIVSTGMNPNMYGIDTSFTILKNGIDEMLRLKPNVKGVYVGSAGFATGGGKDVERLLKEAYPRIKIKCSSDMYNAVVSVVDQKPCIASICGTGLIVFKFENGVITRLNSGYGSLIEKTGSGYDIGLQALRVALEERDGIGAKSLITELVEQKFGGVVWEHIHEIYNNESVYGYIAAFAPLVFQAYELGDEQAARILKENADRVAFLINSAYETFQPDENTLALMGSIYHNEVFLGLVKQRLHPNLHIVISDAPPVFGSCLLCCRLCEVATDSIKEKFSQEYAKALGA